MTPVPFDLPVRAAEAAALAALVIEQAERKPLSDDLRSRLAGMAAAKLKLQHTVPYFGSLEKDPIHPSTYYLAVDGVEGKPHLLRIAPASAPASGIFPRAILIGRMRPLGGRESVVNAVPFAANDHENIGRFAEQINPAFLPRPQGARAAIAVGNRHPATSLPAAFDAFRTVLKSSRVNVASTAQLSASREMSTDKVLAGRDGEDPVAPGFTRVSIRQLYFAGIWAAIRAGWREGYSAGADRIIVSGCNPNEVARSLEAAREAVVQAAGYARFAADTCRLFLPEADPRHPAAWSDAAVEEKFETQFDAEERTWIFDEFLKPFQAGDRTYELTRALVMRLAAKFGPGLKLNEELYDAIRRARMGQPQLSFDFEAAIDETAYPTTPGELIFVLQWLKARGRPAQLVAPNPGIGGPPGETSARLKELASVARYFHATLSIDSGIGHTESQLGTIARATMGRVNYKVSAELQLELFDVLAEQPEGSYWHALYRRMAARANEFAALGAFGAAGCEASRYRDVRLGDPANGRTDGNLFLVRCIGNVAGSRDVHDPAGDHRFFQEKLDELPADLAAEVRRRNTGYITRVAEHLVG